MCLRKIHFLPKRAKEDIIVYKVMRDRGNHEYTSPFYPKDNTYRLGTIIHSTVSPLWGIIVNYLTYQGVHAFIMKERAEKLAKIKGSGYYSFFCNRIKNS